MRPKHVEVPSTARTRTGFKTKITLLGAALMVGAAVNVQADHPVSVPLASGMCPADTVGSALNCTSSDIVIALVTAEDEAAKCVHGETAMLNLQTQVQVNAASARHDVAAWIPTTAELGKNMLLTSANGGPATCQSKGFHFPIAADDAGPIVVDDQDGDQCGDINGINDTFTRPFTNATVGCDGTVGGAEVDAVVSWHLSGNDPVCSDHQDYGDFKKSKCSNTTSFVDLVVVGNLTVCKAAADGTDGDFEFTIQEGMVWEDGTGGDEVPVDAGSPFLLNPADGSGGVMCTSFDVLTNQAESTNTVTIQETDIPAESSFTVADVSCINNVADGAPADFIEGSDFFTIELTEGDIGEGGTDPGQPDVTCTFTNTEGGSLTIVKDATPDSAQDFAYTGDLGAFTLDDDADGTLSNSATFDNLDPDTYEVTESDVAGWTLTGVACEDDEGSVTSELAGSTLSVAVEAGQNVMCTFSNVQEGRAIVRKEVLPDTDPTEFAFTGDVAGSISGGNEIELVIANPLANGAGLTSTETIPAGWDLVNIQCDDGNSSGDGIDTATFNVEPGETVTCIFTNVLRGSIVVQKTAIGGDDTFDFTRSWGENFSIVTAGGTGMMTFDNLSASDEVTESTYSVEEITDGLEAARWNYDGVVCNGSEGVEDNTAIDLDPGETVTCEFTNSKYASVTIRKEIINGPDDEFCFTITLPDDEPSDGCVSTVDGSFEESLDNAPVGNYSFVENTEPPWVLHSATCDDGQDPADFTIAAGDDIVCTFVNIIPNPVPVNNRFALLLLILLMLSVGYWQTTARRRN